MKCVAIRSSFSGRPNCSLPSAILFIKNVMLRASVRIVCRPSPSCSASPGARPWMLFQYWLDAIGIPEEELRHAAQLSVCKINIDSDIRLAITASIREHFAEHPDHFDPRQYLKPARQAVKDMVTHKLINVLGCNGKA